MESIYESYASFMLSLGIESEDYAKRFVFWAVVVGGVSYYLKPSQMFYATTGQMRPWMGWAVLDNKETDADATYVTWPLFTLGLAGILTVL